MTAKRWVLLLSFACFLLAIFGVAPFGLALVPAGLALLAGSFLLGE